MIQNNGGGKFIENMLKGLYVDKESKENLDQAIADFREAMAEGLLAFGKAMEQLSSKVKPKPEESHSAPEA